jgi:hypothetical protein
MNDSLARLMAIGAAIALLPSLAGAQDVSEDPTYGTVTLTAGFRPDPHVQEVAAGGANLVELAGCKAYIHAAAPDLDLNYRAGGLPLTITVRSRADVVLLINTPDGRWHCDDDSAGGTDSKLTFGTPQSGLYNIWVGTYEDTDDLPAARVYFSELGASGSAPLSRGSSGASPALQTIRVCAIEDGALQEVLAQYNPVTGDTLVNGRLFRTAHPTGPQYADGAVWYAENQPITLRGLRYVKYGLPRVLGVLDLVPLAEYRGLRVFAEAGASNPEVVYVPVRPGCEFQPYALRA